MLAGGLLYTAGGVVYAMRRPEPVPAVFGYHEIFHVLVVAAVVPPVRGGRVLGRPPGLASSQSARRRRHEGRRSQGRARDGEARAEARAAVIFAEPG